jgi:hypothetical protein
MSDRIASYVEQLERELRLRHAPRRRLLAEAEDHLRSESEELVEQGVKREEAERVAIERFGAAALVARSFAHAYVSRSTKAALVWVIAAFCAYSGAVLAIVLTAPSWLLDFPQGAPSMLALQVAFVALVLGTVRVLRHRRSLVIVEPQLRFAANGAAVAALALAGAAFAEFLLGWTRPVAAPWHEETSLLALYGAVCVISIVVALVACGTLGRAQAVARTPRAGADLASGSAALAQDVAALSPALAPLAGAAVAHPARACALVAGVAFVAMTGVSVPDSSSLQHASALAGALTAGAFEAAAVVVGYLAFGRILGIRPDRGAAGRRAQ